MDAAKLAIEPMFHVRYAVMQMKRINQKLVTIMPVPKVAPPQGIRLGGLLHGIFMFEAWNIVQVLD